MERFSQKFIGWLRVVGGGDDWGAQAEICRETGLEPDQVCKMLGKHHQGNIGVNTLQEIARHRGQSTWELVWCIEHRVSRMPPRE